MTGINYYDSKFCDRFDGLTYCDMRTDIIGNTFYIKKFCGILNMYML